MNNRMVRKSNALIEASYKLSAAEQRVIFFLVSMIHPDDEEFREYILSIKEFADLAGLKHKGEYSEVKEITKRLIGRVLEISTPTGLLQVAWLSSAKYLDGTGQVSLHFDKELKPYLLQLKDRFTKFGLEQVIRLKSSYSIRLYELLKQYSKLGERTFFLDDFRTKMGIEKDLYRNFNTLKRNVILVAQEELVEKTDISFKFEEIKIGRSVGKIRFSIKSKSLQKVQLAEAVPAHIIPDLEKTIPLENQDLTKLVALLPQEYRGKESIAKLLREALPKHGFDYVARNIEYANDGSNAVNPGASLGKGSNYRHYLAKALKGDFGLASKEDQEARQAQEEKARQEKEAALAAATQERNRTQMEQENLARARVYRESLSPEAQETLREEALTKMDPAQRDLVSRKSAGSELLLKRTMDKICLERMKLA